MSWLVLREIGSSQQVKSQQGGKNCVAFLLQPPPPRHRQIQHTTPKKKENSKMSTSESDPTAPPPPSPTMPLYLALSRPSPSQRAHFALYIPSLSSLGLDPNSEGRGTLIHVVGAPMAGFQHEVLREHACWEARPKRACTRLGELGGVGAEEVEKLAMRIRPPGISENFMAPVDGVSGLRFLFGTLSGVVLMDGR